MAEAHILLVEDDASLAEWVSAYLTSHGFQVSHVADGAQAVTQISALNPDLVLLDVMLPHKSGFEVCKEVRAFFSNPILMLTACTEDQDEIMGLELGATDFMGKPVRPQVLLARIKALLRRALTQPEIHQLEFGVLKLTAEDKQAQLAGEPVVLTTAEFDLLWLLASHAGDIVSRDSLLQSQRGIEYDGFDRSVDVMISRLRKKLGDTQSPATKIKTVRTKGYLFSPTAWDD